MRKAYIALPLLAASLGMFAEDNFYYVRDGRMELKEVEGKRVVIMPTVPSQIARMKEFANSRRVVDRPLIVEVVPDTSSTLLSMKSISLPVRIEKCYVDSQGLELTPTGYINLKLKKEEDIDLLKKRAAEFGLEITEQFKYMPLWYELVINFENEESVIDIANRLYETGDFESCAPAFSFDPHQGVIIKKAWLD